LLAQDSILALGKN